MIKRIFFNLEIPDIKYYFKFYFFNYRVKFIKHNKFLKIKAIISFHLMSNYKKNI